MPIDGNTLGAITGGLNTLGGIANDIGTIWQNNKNQDFSEHMYDRQKNDNISFWNMQNAYNTPQAQMQRFQAAGLNPNLIYGQGTPGNAAAISTPQVQPVHFQAPQVPKLDMLQYANMAADLKIKQAQANNLEVQNTVLLEDHLLRKNQRETGEFNLGFNKDLSQTSADFKRESLRQLTNSIDLSNNEDARRTTFNAASVDDIMEKIRKSQAERGKIGDERKNIRSQTYNNELGSFKIQNESDLFHLESRLRQMDIELRGKGVTPHMSMWDRIMARELTNFGVDLGYH